MVFNAKKYFIYCSKGLPVFKNEARIIQSCLRIIHINNTFSPKFHL